MNGNCRFLRMHMPSRFYIAKIFKTFAELLIQQALATRIFNFHLFMDYISKFVNFDGKIFLCKKLEVTFIGINLAVIIDLIYRAIISFSVLERSL